MPDRLGNYPLQPWRNRAGADVRKWARYLPEVTVTIGADDVSAGVTITAWEPSQGEFATYRTLWHRRWVDKPQSVQEALYVAGQAVQAALAELFGVEQTGD